MPTPEETALAEVEQDRKEVEAMNEAINALIQAGSLAHWTVLARMLMAKYLRQLARSGS